MVGFDNFGIPLSLKNPVMKLSNQKLEEVLNNLGLSEDSILYILSNTNGI